LLVEHFFQKYSRENDKFLDAQGKTRLSFAADAMQLLIEHSWPGNVRELENAVERAVVLAADEVVPLDVLPDQVLHAGGLKIRRDESGRLPADASLFEIVADYERRKIVEALEACNWSQTEAAEMLRIPLSTLNQKIKRLDIQIKRRGT
jgi:DNA-binding NtrC family response regulator